MQVALEFNHLLLVSSCCSIFRLMASGFPIGIFWFPPLVSSGFHHWYLLVFHCYLLVSTIGIFWFPIGIFRFPPLVSSGFHHWYLLVSPLVSSGFHHWYLLVTITGIFWFPHWYLLEELEDTKGHYIVCPFVVFFYWPLYCLS